MIVYAIAHVVMFLLYGIAIFGCLIALAVGIVWKEFNMRARCNRRTPR